MNTKEIITVGHKIYDLHVYSLKSYEEISISMNMTKEEVTKICSAYCRLTQRQIPVSVRTAGRNRELEKEIITLRNSGKTLTEISEIVGKSRTRCGQIIKRYERSV